MNAIQKIDVNDPRLTAYALGELEGTERAEIEAAVKADASLASEVDAIRAMAGSLEAELSGEETPRLSYEQRERVATHRGGFFAKFKKQRWMQGLAAVAGCGIVAVVSTQVDRSPVETSVTPPAEKQSVTTNEEKKESLSNEVTKTLNQAVQDSIGRPPREVKPMKDPAPEAEADMMAPRAPAPVAAQPPGARSRGGHDGAACAGSGRGSAARRIGCVLGSCGVRWCGEHDAGRPGRC